MTINKMPSTTATGLRTRGRSLHAALADELGLRIARGDYPVGSPLPREGQLFETFGVSRPVLREAIKALASKGMLESRQRRGTIVLPRSRWNLLDPDILGWDAVSEDLVMLRHLTEVRMIIEPGASELAAIRQNVALIDAVETAFAAMVSFVDDTPRYLVADRDFHLAVLAASENDYLQSIGSLISTVLRASLRITNPTPKLNRASLGLHEQLLSALRQGDGPGAAHASRIQLGDAMKRLSAYARKRLAK